MFHVIAQACYVTKGLRSDNLSDCYLIPISSDIYFIRESRLNSRFQTFNIFTYKVSYIYDVISNTTGCFLSTCLKIITKVHAYPQVFHVSDTECQN